MQATADDENVIDSNPDHPTTCQAHTSREGEYLGFWRSTGKKEAARAKVMSESQRWCSYGNEEGLPAELTLIIPSPHQQQQQNTHAFASPLSLSSSHSATVQDATVVASGLWRWQRGRTYIRPLVR